MMEQCCLCHKDLMGEKKYLLIDAASGQRWYICKPCERTLNLVTDGRRKRWIHLAVEELKQRVNDNEDPGLRKFLGNLIEIRERRAGMHRTCL